MTREINNIRELLLNSASKYSTKDAFRIKKKGKVEAISYATLKDDVTALSTSLAKEGLLPKNIAVLGENSYEWVVSYLAVITGGGVAVPIDKDLSKQEIDNILTDSDSAALIYSDNYDDVIEPLIDKFESIKFIVKHSSKDDDKKTSFKTMLAKGRELIENGDKFYENVVIDRESMCEIVFTSGTTGFSKGVMLSHKNIIANVYTAFQMVNFEEGVISVLPMHHTIESTLNLFFPLFHGKTISINDSLKYFAQNLILFSPTEMVVVPLVVESIYNNIMQSVRLSGKEKLFKTMIKVSRGLLKIGIDVRKILFKKIHNNLGGRLNTIFCGGAFLDPAIAQAFKDFGFNLYIGYGITECSPLLMGNISNRDDKMDSCGPAVPDCTVILKDIDENGEGEICAKGDNVMMGYYKNEEATKKVFDEDGWFRTGDIGHFDSDGYMRITGRIKNLIVLKNGKNIYPEELEMKLSKSPYIKEVVVYAVENDGGEELCVTAEIFPNKESLEYDKIAPEDVRSTIDKAVGEVNDTLPYYKRILDIRIRETEFDKTTTKKIKRFR